MKFTFIIYRIWKYKNIATRTEVKVAEPRVHQHNFHYKSSIFASLDRWIKKFLSLRESWTSRNHRRILETHTQHKQQQKFLYFFFIIQHCSTPFGIIVIRPAVLKQIEHEFLLVDRIDFVETRIFIYSLFFQFIFFSGGSIFECMLLCYDKYAAEAVKSCCVYSSSVMACTSQSNRCQCSVYITHSFLHCVSSFTS